MIEERERTMSSMTQEDKEKLAERIVALLKDEDPKARVAELQAKVEAGDEGEDGMNSAILAVSIAMLEHFRL